MKKAFSLSFLLLIAASCFSQSVSLEQAGIAASNFFYERAAAAGKSDLSKMKISAHYEKAADWGTLYYIFNFEGKGFVIISGIRNVIPVLGYSLEEDYIIGITNPAFDRWMLDYQKQIEIAFTEKILASGSVTEEWNRLLTAAPGTLNSLKGVKSVAPLLHTKWDQGKFYNDFCPADQNGPDLRTWAGCVPTTLGQIMNYYRYPQQGTGSYTYVHPTYDTLSADFGSATYDWDQMPLQLTFYNNAVAQLLFHLGVSVDLDYGPNGSGMFNHKAAFSERTYFGYSPDCEYVFRDTCTMNWRGLLLSHLDAGKPLYYAGWADTINVSGHAFVCDGYQDTNYYHFNWGWSGSYDGYYFVDNLTPGGNDFTLDHELIINFYPDTSLSYPYYCSGTKMLTEMSGTLGDGSGPIYDYQNDADCYWLIAPADSVTGITLHFLEFKTESDSDVVIVYNGSSISDPVLGIYSGSSLPPNVITSGSVMLVRFISNGYTTDNGWLANYTTTSSVYCTGIQTLTASSGTFGDGSGNASYHVNRLCRWSIQPTGATGILLHFNSLVLGEGDYVQVSDVTHSVVLDYITGDTLPADIYCPSGNMLLLFRSDSRYVSDGWEVEYSDASGIAGGEAEADGYMVFPIPANNTLNVRCGDNLDEKISVELFNAAGIRVLSQIIEGKGVQTNIDISHLTGGVYFMMLGSNSKVVHRKIIIQ